MRDTDFIQPYLEKIERCKTQVKSSWLLPYKEVDYHRGDYKQQNSNN